MEKVQRTVTVPLVMGKSERDTLHEIAAVSSRFANEMLTARYIKAKKLEPPAVYTDYSDDLSACVRDAVNKEVQAVWSKFAKRCLAGYMSLPTFSADRALTIRDRGVEVARNAEGFDVRLKVLPGNEDWFSYPVYDLRLKKDLYLANLLGHLVDGYRVTKGAVVFDRRNPKRNAIRISYEKEIDPKTPGRGVARLGPVGENGELYIRAEHKVQSLTHYVQLLQNKKRDLGGIWQRVKLSKRRDAMKKCEHFEDWALGVLHQMSSSITQFGVDNKCGGIEWRIALDGELPFAKLKMLCTYKARENGIEVVEEDDLTTPPPRKEKLQWARQLNKNLREIGQATRKM